MCVVEMEKNQLSPVFKACSALALLVGCAFSLSCVLSGYAVLTPGETVSVTERLLGDARFALSKMMYTRADVFFHKGVSYHRDKAFNDPFQALKEKISPFAHKHLHGMEVKEIMPWLRMAMKINPGDPAAGTVAAFWLATDCGRPDLAEKVLDETRRNAPGDYRVYLEQGRLFLKTGREDRAAKAFDIVIRLCSDDELKDDSQVFLDLAEALTYRGLIHESKGDISSAVSAYKRVLRMFPDREGLRNRLAALSGGSETEVKPADLWDDMLSRRRHVCDQEQDHDHDH